MTEELKVAEPSVDLTLVICIVIVVAGIVFYFVNGRKRSPNSLKVDTTTGKGDKGNEADASGKTPISPGKRFKAADNLENLSLPGNFPSDVAFYFGSQTGTAEKFAQALSDEATKLGVETAKVIDFEDFAQDAFTTHSLVIVVIATHYEGDPCDNTKKFYKWFKEQMKKPEDKIMSKVHFSVFGLGDTSYEQYNAMGRQIDKGLEEMGASRAYKYGEGNAEGNHTEDDFIEWKQQLWADLIKYYKEKEPVNGGLEKKPLIRMLSKDHSEEG